MRTQSIDYIVKLANTYLSLHPSLRQGESLYLAAYNYLEDYGTIKEKEHFDTLVKDSPIDCYYYDYRINPFIRTLEQCV